MATKTKPSAPPAPPAATPQRAYREVPLDELAANPLNGRRKLTGIAEMADSIRAVGILEPLLLTPADNGQLLVVFGHRRFAAAKQAGLDTVPSIVRTDLDEGQVLQAAIIENNQRENLTYLEEAGQLQRLMDLRALPVRDLAKAVGRSAQYVTGRLALLTLPEAARAALDRGSITLDIALQLAGLADYPEIVADLVDEDGEVDPYLLEAARERVTVERECARLVEEAKAKGLRLIDDDPLSQGFRYLATLDLTTGQQAAHRRQSCHAVYLDRSFGRSRLVPVCTAPDRHRPAAAKPETADNAGRGSPADSPDGDAGERLTGQPTRDAATGGEQDRAAQLRERAEERKRAEEERERNRKRVAKARREYLAGLAGKRIKRGDAAAFAFGAIIERANTNHLATVGKALGLTPGEGAYGQTDWRTPVAAHAADSGDNLLKVAFLVSCAWAEDHTGPYTGGYDGFAARYVETLAKLGYEPDPYETQQIAEARSRSEQPESDADDPTDDQHDNDEHADEPDETAPEADDSAA